MKYNEYYENRQHGTNEFPLQLYSEKLISREEKHIPLHWHREFEIMRVIEGTVPLFLNGVEYNLKAGEVAFIGCGMLHQHSAVNNFYEVVVFDLRMVSGYGLSKISDLIQPILSGDAEILMRCPEADGIVNQLFETIIEKKPFYELKITSLIADLVYCLYANNAVVLTHTENKRFAHRREVMTLLIDYIEANYKQKITLSDLACISQINEKYLCRFFREFTGLTPIDYINRLRIDHACFDMTVNKRNVTEAAYENGFNELSYFSKCFKKYKGVSPGQFKQKNS